MHEKTDLAVVILSEKDSENHGTGVFPRLSRRENKNCFSLGVQGVRVCVYMATDPHT